MSNNWKISKSAVDVEDYAIDWINWLDDNETLASVVVAEETGNIPIVSQQIVGSQIRFRLGAGGQINKTYHVEAIATSTAGRKKQCCLSVFVRDC